MANPSSATERANVPRINLRPREFAEANGISMATFWRRVKAGEISVRRSGRITLVPAEQRLGEPA